MGSLFSIAEMEGEDIWNVPSVWWRSLSLLGERGPEGFGRSEEPDSLGAGRAFWVSRHPEEVE